MPQDRDSIFFKRKLAAIMFTDIMGYTAMMGKDAAKALEILRLNREIHTRLIDKHNGKLLKEMGDGNLVQFESAIDAVHCAVEIQQNAGQAMDAKIRIGIHLGDITTENEDVFGDGVNIASRLQSIADPGGIYFSDSIQHAIRGNSDIKSEYFGAVNLKNVDYPVNTYYLANKGFPIPSRKKKIQLSGSTRRSLFRSIYTYLLLALVLILSVVIFRWVRTERVQDIKAIAILPVENLSENTDQEWLSAGIHNALINELGKIHAFRVTSRTSSMKYLRSDKTIPEIAQELKVDGIMEASYMRTAESINIQVRLFETQPEEQLVWQQDYNREIEDILYIYNDVAKSIAQVVQISLSSEEEINLTAPRRIEPMAYEAYLRGMSHWEKGTRSDLDRAMNYFEMARDIDPTFALAHLGIANVWGAYVQHGFMSFYDAKTEREKAFNKAIQLDSTSAEIRGWIAIKNSWSDWNWEKAGLEYERSLSINPNDPFVQAYYAHYLEIIGQAEKGLPHSELAVELDPLNSLYQSIHGMFLKNNRQYDDALEVLYELIRTEPGQGIGLPALWAVYHEMGDFDKAFETARQIYDLKGNEVAIRILEEEKESGGYAQAMKGIAEMMVDGRDSRYYPPWQICTLYCRAMMKEEAIKWLELAFEEHDNNLPYISIDPLFDFLRDDARFKRILQEMNLPEIQFDKK